jgi:hypothetical protein
MAKIMHIILLEATKAIFVVATSIVINVNEVIRINNT